MTTKYDRGLGLKNLEEMYVRCTCCDPEHHMLLSFYSDEEDEADKELFITVYLAQWRNIFKRIRVAIRYIFGYRSRYGDWDCINLDKYKANEVIGFLQGFLES